MQEIAVDNNKQLIVNTVCCYVCGREFGTRGFPFHHKECLVKYGNQQKKKPLQERIKLPDPPQELKFIISGDLSKVDLRKQESKKIRFNELAINLFKYKVLPACKYCKRTFNAQSLAVHIKGCSKKPSGYEEKENTVVVNLKVPKALVCCVCGQRFSTASLKIHYPECLKKFRNEEFRKHKKESDRRNPPEFSPEDLQAIEKMQWNENEMEDFNTRATQLYRNHGMAECDNCGRKFFFQQFQKHRKNCELINGKLNLGKPLLETKQSKTVMKPKSIACFLCGRQYGTKSINIHTFQCEEMFLKLQEKKLNQQKKQMPILSSQIKKKYDLSKAEEWSRQEIQSYNKLAFDCYNKKSLSKCYICQRTFFEQSLPKHLKNCQSQLKDMRKLQKLKKQVSSNKSFFGDNFIENVIQINKQLSTPQLKEGRKPKMLMCLLCGRQYGVCSLKIHLPKCRGETHEKKLALQSLMEDIKSRYHLEEAEKWTEAQIQEYNKQIYDLYKKQSLFECKYCHRTFFEESLKKHIKHCEKEATKKSLKRSQTMKNISSFQTMQEEKDGQSIESIHLHKMQSEKIIHEEQQEGQDTYHALEYGSLMTEEIEQQNEPAQFYQKDSQQNTISGNASPGVIEIQDL